MSEAWDKVKKVFENKERLWTLSETKRKSEFELIDFFEDYITIKTSANKIRRINRDEIENSYDYLLKNGKITRKQIMRDFSTFNPAYVAAIIASFENVAYNLEPIITLYIV